MSKNMDNCIFYHHSSVVIIRNAINTFKNNWSWEGVDCSLANDLLIIFSQNYHIISDIAVLKNNSVD